MQLHPGKKIQEELKDRGWTQRQFAFLLGKKVSEVNELIKGKRNITVQRDILLSHVLGTSRKYRLDLQNEYEYYLVESDFDISKLPDIDQNVSSPDKKIHQTSKQENKPDIVLEKINQTPQNIVSQQKKEEKQASQANHNLNKEHKIDKDVDMSKQQKKHPKFDQQKIAEDSKKLQKIEINQNSKTFDLNNKIITQEGQVKKDKYEIQKIYNHNDRFDSYFAPKEKKSDTEKQDGSKPNTIQNTVSSKGQKSTKEKIHNPKDHLKNKEHIFRNF